MKKSFRIILAGLLLISVTIVGNLTVKEKYVSPPEDEGVLCHGVEDANAIFTAFADQTDFRESHELPRAIKPKKLAGKMVSFKTSDKKKGKAYLVKAEIKSNQYLLMFHEWWGLNEHIKQEADQWALDLKDVNIIAIDLYDGEVATTREQASDLMQSVSPKRAENLIRGAINYVGHGAKLGSIGWCFGGGWSLQSAMIAKQSMKACVVYYGMPEKDVYKLKSRLYTDVFGVFAKQDKWITPEVVDEFKKNMESAGKKLKVEIYDADHAFANPSSPRYNEAAAQDARTKVVRYIRRVL